MKKQLKKAKSRIINVLQNNANKSYTGTQLSYMADIPYVTVRKLIRDLVFEGAGIVSSQYGFMYCTDKVVIQQEIKTLKSRAKHIKKRAKTLAKLL